MTSPQNNSSDSSVSAVEKYSVLKNIALYIAASALLILAHLAEGYTWLLSVLSVSAFTVLFSRSGPKAVLSLIIPLAASAFFMKPVTELMVISFLPAAISMGQSFKKKDTPGNTVIGAFTAHLAGLSAALVIIVLVYNNGSFSEFFGKFSDYVDSVLAAIAAEVPEEFKSAAELLLSLSELFKVIMIGTVLAFEAAAVCLSYFASLIISKLIGNKSFEVRAERFDLRTTRLCSYVYMISFLIMTFSPVGTGTVSTLISLALNIFIVMTPIYFCTGIYYLIRVKYKAGNKKPTMLIICIALSVLLGMFYLLLLYIVFSGAYYSSMKNTDAPSKPFGFRR